MISDDTLETMTRWIVVVGLAAIVALFACGIVVILMFLTGNACR